MIKKETLKNYIYAAELQITAQITNAVLKREGKIPTLRSVKRKITNLKVLNDLEKNTLWLWAYRFYRHTVAGAGRKTNLDDRSAAMYTVLRKDTPDLEHVKNEITDNYEHREKHTRLVNILRNDAENFYYCTEHANCAGDHQAYQGRIYYRRSGTYSKEEQQFIHDHDLLSVEEVVMGPVWLTTRRNCRHRLVPIPFSSVQTGDYRDVRDSEDISYEEGQYRFYKDRRKLLLTAKKVYDANDVKISQLEVDLKKTNQLVRAWRIKKNSKTTQKKKS